MLPEIWQSKSRSFSNPLTYDEVPIEHPARHFYDYWNLLCGDRAFALKSEFNPGKVIKQLPYIGVVKLDFSGPEFDLYLTLVGERIKEFASIKSHCSYRKDLFTGHDLTDRLALYESVSKNPEAKFFKMRVPFEGRDYLEIIKGMFPFSSNGIIVDYIFLVIDKV